MESRTYTILSAIEVCQLVHAFTELDIDKNSKTYHDVITVVFFIITMLPLGENKDALSQSLRQSLHEAMKEERFQDLRIKGQSYADALYAVSLTLADINPLNSVDAITQEEIEPANRVVTSDGYQHDVYELQRWLKQKNANPSTKQPFSERDLQTIADKLGINKTELKIGTAYQGGDPDPAATVTTIEDLLTRGRGQGNQQTSFTSFVDNDAVLNNFPPLSHDYPYTFFQRPNAIGFQPFYQNTIPLYQRSSISPQRQLNLFYANNTSGYNLNQLQRLINLPYADHTSGYDLNNHFLSNYIAHVPNLSNADLRNLHIALGHNSFIQQRPTQQVIRTLLSNCLAELALDPLSYLAPYHFLRDIVFRLNEISTNESPAESVSLQQLFQGEISRELRESFFSNLSSLSYAQQREYLIEAIQDIFIADIDADRHRLENIQRMEEEPSQQEPSRNLSARRP